MTQMYKYPIPYIYTYRIYMGYILYFYTVSQDCHRVFFCDQGIYYVLYIMYYMLYHKAVTEFSLSVQALVGGSSSAREDSETDCEVRRTGQRDSL